MRSRELAKLIRTTAIVAMLVFAQAAVAAHVDLADSHPAGEECALCAGHSVLGAGNVAVSLPVEAEAAAPPIVGHACLRAPDRRIERRFARGPPRTS